MNLVFVCIIAPFSLKLAMSRRAVVAPFIEEIHDD